MRERTGQILTATNDTEFLMKPLLDQICVWPFIIFGVKRGEVTMKFFIKVCLIGLLSIYLPSFSFGQEINEKGVRQTTSWGDQVREALDQPFYELPREFTGPGGAKLAINQPQVINWKNHEVLEAISVIAFTKAEAAVPGHGQAARKPVTI